MTDEEWAAVRDQLPVPAWMNGKGGQPEGYCSRQMIDAIRYLVDNGIKWRAMPVDFPAWDRVYAFWRRWRETGLIAEFHDRLRGKVRESEGRTPEPTAAIIDSQSVKAAAQVPAASRGFDGGKKINGRKRTTTTPRRSACNRGQPGGPQRAHRSRTDSVSCTAATPWRHDPRTSQLKKRAT
ncbi:transposase [Streptomyces sp. NPDC051000]|uniref:transposase n=1 Tax=Streptomyces sp. NPDC051000 TaxID=3155520 RepID=UPI0033D88517